MDVSTRSQAQRAAMPFAGLALVAALVGGCSTEAPEPTAVSQTADARILADAQGNGASEEQLAILQAPPITFPKYQEAVNRTLTCMRDAGIEVGGDTVSDVNGVPQIPYSFAASSPGRTDDQTLAIADECAATHSMFVEAAYQTQPGSIEAQEAAFEPYRDAIVTCIEDNGGTIDAEASATEIVIASAKTAESSGTDCAKEAGYGG